MPIMPRILLSLLAGALLLGGCKTNPSGSNAASLDEVSEGGVVENDTLFQTIDQAAANRLRPRSNLGCICQRLSGESSEWGLFGYYVSRDRGYRARTETTTDIEACITAKASHPRECDATTTGESIR